MTKPNVFIRATVPDDLLKAFLQHVRDFDVANDGCHFEILADCQDVPMSEIIERIRLEPGFEFEQVFTRKGGKA